MGEAPHRMAAQTDVMGADHLERLVAEEERRMRRNKALEVVQRALRYLDGYLTDYDIKIARKVYDDRVEVVIVVRW